MRAAATSRRCSEGLWTATHRPLVTGQTLAEVLLTVLSLGGTVDREGLHFTEGFATDMVLEAFGIQGSRFLTDAQGPEEFEHNPVPIP